MKIAIVHDYIKEYGGAERVLEVIHEMFPKAPVFTIIYASQFLGPHRERFLNWKIKPSFLQHIPFSYKFISIYRLIAPFVFKSFDFSGYDLVIVSATGAYSTNIIKKAKAAQICYCHTPPRYLYGYKTAREKSKNPFMKAIIAVMLHILRMVDFASSKNVDIFIANSKNIAARINKFYRRDSIVVYPPVDIPTVFIEEEKEDYFLAGGRLARPKHMDLIVKACTELRINLKVFGKSFAGYGKELEGMAGNMVEFLGEVSDREKTELMKKARAFMIASEDEDFGIVPVEAMASGTPVIAYRSGGIVESVIEGKTGIFFDDLSVKAVMDAINKFEKTIISQQDCFKQSEKFSKEQFVNGIKKVINRI